MGQLVCAEVGQPCCVWRERERERERERDLELARTFNRILFKVTVQLLRKLQECTFVALWGSLNNVYPFVFLPTPNEISRLSLSPLGISTCDRSHIVHCCCALLIVFKEKTLKTRNFTAVWAAERENDKDRMLVAFDLLSWETFLRGWHRCFLETQERERLVEMCDHP